MDIKNILELLRKSDDNTLSEIQDQYSADWEMDELFDKSFEKYLSESNTKDTEKIISVEYSAEERSSALNLTAHRIIPAAACFALIAVSAKYISTYSSDNKTENQDVYNAVHTTSATISEESEASRITDSLVTVSTDKRITKFADVTEYTSQSVEKFINTQTNAVSAATEKQKTENTGTMPVTTVPVETLISDTAVSTTVKPSEKRKISVEDILRLSHKGSDLDWSDFDEYEYTDVGSGLFVYEYKLKESMDYVLRIGGIPEEKPYYIWLMPAEYDSSKYFDITFCTEEQIKEYLKYFPEQPDKPDDDGISPAELAEKDFESYVLKYKYESAELDLDNDGITEQCIITYVPESGCSVHIISVYAEGKLKYRNTFDLDTSKMVFTVIDGIPYVRMEMEKSSLFEKYTEDHKIYTVGKKIVIEYMDSVYEWYWGGEKYNLEME